MSSYRSRFRALAQAQADQFARAVAKAGKAGKAGKPEDTSSDPDNSAITINPDSLASPPPAPLPPLLLTPRILTPRNLRLLPSDGSPASLQFPLPDSASAQLRYTVELNAASQPSSIHLPRQPLTLSPPRWIPQQSIPVTILRAPQAAGSDGRRASLTHRILFRCPFQGCRRRTNHLYLILDPALATCLTPPRRSRFLCRHCLAAAFPRPSDLNHWTVYQAARDPFRPGISLSLQLRALPVWWRWQTEGKNALYRGTKGTRAAVVAGMPPRKKPTKPAKPCSPSLPSQSVRGTSSP
jgi:hypothetical protein